MATLASAGLGTLSSVADVQVPVPIGQEGGRGGNAVDPSVEPDVPAPPDAVDDSVDHNVPVPAAMWWPSDTDIVFILGMNRLSLMIQHPPVRAVIQDSFEHI